MQTNSQTLNIEKKPTYIFTITKQTPRQRLDRFLAQQLTSFSRARIQQWIVNGYVLLNNEIVKPKDRIQAGDHITVWVQPSPEESAYEPEEIALDCIYESTQVIVVNKPAGMVVHPGAGHWSGTLLNALLFHFPELKQVERAGIVHRLDKDTSGLLMIARNPAARTHLVNQLKARSVLREYRALCQGGLKGTGQINTPILRDPRVAVRMVARDVPGARSARTNYAYLRSGVLHQHPVSELSCSLHTGRTHQIRVHLSSINHPILGDGLYGGLTTNETPRQMLHAFHLAFKEPITNKNLAFKIPPPIDYQQLCGQ